MKHLYTDPTNMKPKAKCKPCITIRTALKLFWRCYVTDATKNFRDEYRSYSRVNATACELDFAPKYIPVDKQLAAIRKLAQENFDEGKKLSAALEERKNEKLSSN